jgi:hypothetical protein
MNEFLIRLIDYPWLFLVFCYAIVGLANAVMNGLAAMLSVIVRKDGK